MAPSEIFLTKGTGYHSEKLFSFELALREARIAPYNLVPVSSIFPPDCKIIKREEGINKLHYGDIVHLVLSRHETHKPETIAASVGLAIPSEKNQYGYLSEHHATGLDKKIIGRYTQDLAASMLVTILELEYNPEWNYEKKMKIFKESGSIDKTLDITQVAQGRDGVWTTVIAAAVFVP